MTVGGLAGAAMVGCSSAPKPAAPASAPQTAGTSAPAAKTYPKGAQVPVNTGKIKEGGTFTEAATTVSPEFDAHTTLTSSQWRNAGELGILPDPWTAELVANVVESWEVPDANTLILKVRDNVAIHNKPPWNGRLFDAEDLAFNMNRIQGNTADAEGIPRSGFQRASTLEAMKSVEVVDKSHVKVTLKAPTGQFLSGFTEHRNFLMPKGVVEVGFKDPLKLSGTSAYEMTGYDTTKEVYTRFDKYWNGKGHFDKYVRTVIPDRAATAAAFISKQTSVLASPTDPEIKTIKGARPDALYYQTPGYLVSHIRPNTKYGALSDFRVRKAVQLTLNYQDLIVSGGDGSTYAMAVSNSYPESWSSDKVQTLPGFNKDTKDKDIADAVKLMTASGHEGGKGVDYEITVQSTSVQNREFSLRMQSQLAKVFPQIKIALKPVDAAAFSKLQSGRDFQGIAYNIGPAPAISPEAFAHYHTKGARNYGSFTNAECDALLEKGLAALKQEDRKTIYEEWQTKFLNDWVPWWGMYIAPVSAFLQPDIAGYDITVGPWSEWWEYYRINKVGFVG
ncbi:MAG: ABC transporter substrate-binding protein [Chloroflexota bacterium]